MGRTIPSMSCAEFNFLASTRWLVNIAGPGRSSNVRIIKTRQKWGSFGRVVFDFLALFRIVSLLPFFFLSFRSSCVRSDCSLIRCNRRGKFLFE